MFCPNCGSKVPDNAKFCGTCGHPIRGNASSAGAGAATPQTASRPQGTAPASTVVPRKSSRLPLVIAAAAVVVVIAVIVACHASGPAWYRPLDFVNAGGEDQAKSLEAAGFKYDENNRYWRGTPSNGPYDDEHTELAMAAEDDDSELSKDDLENGKDGRTYAIRYSSIDLGDGGTDDALDELVDNFDLGKADDTIIQNGGGVSYGKCEVGGKEGIWLTVVMPNGLDGGSYSAGVMVGTVKALGYDSYDDATSDLSSSSPSMSL